MNTEILNKAKEWTTDAYDDKTRKLVSDLIENDHEELYESFYQDLEFGTGGLRGVMGVGTNRINEYTISMASQGLVNYIKEYIEESRWKIAIAHDSRNNSRLYAEVTARVFQENDFQVYLFEDLRPTPQLSFAVRYHGCIAGVVVTASHNPPEYNGYKVYWEDGAQVVSPQDQGIIAEVRKVTSPSAVQITPDLDGIHLMGKEMDDAFLEAAKSTLIRKSLDFSPLKMVFTSLHGTGGQLIPDALRSMGVNQLIEVQEQAMPNGDFPTVASPNPEEESAMKMALELAEKEGYEMVLGTDPDADRIGIGVRNTEGDLVLLNGNETGALLVHYCLSALESEGSMPKNPYVAKTIVTTDLIANIAKTHNIPCYQTLTGFKYIAAVIREQEGCGHFIVGGEESYGYMRSEFVRDKDAVTASLMIAEMATWARQEHGSVYAYLQWIHERYGHFKEHLVSVKKEGSKGKAAIQAMMQTYRSTPPNSLGGINVAYMDDYYTSIRRFRDGTNEEIKFEKSNVIQFRLEDGSLVTARPSGTEPKIKFYFSVQVEGEGDYDLQKAAAKLKIGDLKKDLVNG